MKTLLILGVITTLQIGGPQSFTDADAVKDVILIARQSIATHNETDETLAQYYTVLYALPAGLNEAQLQRAILEVYVDVGAKARDGYLNEAPVLEVCALSTPYAGAISEETLVLATRAMRPVSLGGDRRVVIDITEIVRANLKGETGNNGIVLGSLTGRRDGDFSILSGKFDNGATAQLRIYSSGSN
jgi:hypothetical protein